MLFIMERPNRPPRYYVTSTDEEFRLALLAILTATWGNFPLEENPDPYYDLSKGYRALELDKIALSDAIVEMLPATMQNEVNILRRSHATVLGDRDEHKKMVTNAKMLMLMPKAEAIMVTNGGEHDYMIESVAAHFGEIYEFISRQDGIGYSFYEPLYPQPL